MIGLSSGSLQLIPYSQEWKTLFDEEKKTLEYLVGHYVEDIQHVGSTSIDTPGMVAKPILDIAIRITTLELVEQCVPELTLIGYEYRGEYGIPGRHYFVKGTPRTHHIHMSLPTSQSWQNQIYFRNYLLEHPEKAAEYANLKKKLVIQHNNDREAYTEAKDPFISEILSLARALYDEE